MPHPPKVSLLWESGGMLGGSIEESSKTLGELKGLFIDTAAQEQMHPQQEVYRVRWWPTVPAGTPGGLFWGVTILQPGKVGDEFFMTHGHFHADRSRAEFYATVSGKGLLLLMNGERNTWAEEMQPGSLHAIDGRYAHRVVNTSSEPLIFWACWGSDAGYDYGTIRERGFGARVLERAGNPALVPQE